MNSNKKFLSQLMIVILTIVCSMTSKAQDFSNFCSTDRFAYVHAFAMNKGGGIEVGLWPQDLRLGFATGFFLRQETFTAQKTYEDNPEYYSVPTATMYTKGLLKLNRYFYITGTIGLNMDLKFYTGMGLRGMIPLGNAKQWSIIIEPEYSTFGLNTRAGIGYIL